MPLQIVLPWIISRYTSGPRPMDIWQKAIPARLVLSLAMAGVVAITPSFQQEDKSFPLYYYALVVLFFAIHQVTLYSMFVSVMAFFARVSDPAVGGTYMTLLNTLTNLGGNWPSTLALWLVDPLTSKQCSAATDNSCASPELAAACVEAGGSCATMLDGYYVECG